MLILLTVIKYKIAQIKIIEYDNSVPLWKGIFLVLCSNKSFPFLYISLFLNNKIKKQCLPNGFPCVSWPDRAVATAGSLCCVALSCAALMLCFCLFPYI